VEAKVDTLTLQGEGTFEIKLQMPPTASAAKDTVRLTLPVFAGGFPAATAQIDLYLSIEHAERIYAQLDPALRLARAHAKWKN
jgi:hypothetical protein